VALGYAIVLRIRTLPKRLFIAQIKTISPVAAEACQEREVVVRGELVSTDGTLKAGKTGAGKILSGKQMICELVTQWLSR
jgi:hypothetical protein